MTVFTYFCKECGAVIEVAPTNTNARLNLVCKGQEPVGYFLATGAHPVTGDHSPERMRQIGQRPL